MNKLYKLMPPFASDYAGVCSVLFELNSLDILYTPGGCSHPIIEADEIRSFSNKSFFSSNLTDIDVIMGVEDKFIANLQALISNNCSVDFVSIIGTPVSTITGVNFQILAKELERRTGIPVLVFNTSGFESYVVGIYNALLQLGERFVDKEAKKKNYINIIGYTPLLMGHKAHLDECLRVLEHCGLEVMFFSLIGNNLKTIKHASKAVLNVVLSPEGIGLAKYLEEKFNTPYILQIPVGLYGMNNLLHLLEKQLGIAIDETIKAEYKINAINISSSNPNNNVLIIGEPLMSIAISECLKKDFGIQQVSIVSQIKTEGQIEQIYANSIFSQIKFLGDEDDLINYVGATDIVIADPLYKNLINEEGGVAFIPLPYVALSGKKFADMNYDYIGKGGFNYFRNYISQQI